MANQVPPAGGATAAGFVPVYDRVRALARRAFSRVKCPHARADLGAEAAALAWAAFTAAGGVATGVAEVAVRRAAAGHTLCGAGG